MKYPLALVLLSASALQGQISGLAVNADGSELQFASSFGLPNSPVSASRIFRYAPGQPELVTGAAVGTVVVPFAPYLSDDGLTRGWTTFQTCFGPCMIFTPRFGLSLTRNGRNIQQFGFNQIRISRNGRWLFDALSPTNGSRLIDLDTGAATPLPGIGPLHLAHAVADDGTLVTSALISAFPVTAALPSPNGIWIMERNQSPPRGVTLPDRVLSAAITPDGRRIFALTAGNLYEIDRQTLNLNVLFSSQTPLVRFSPSAAGDQILLQADQQLLLLQSGAVNEIYSAPEPISEIRLTADGRTAFAVTAANRLLRLRDNAVEELYAPLPSHARQTTSGTVPGSLVRLSGGPFAKEQVLALDGRVLPFVAVGNGTYEAQIPWDFDVAARNEFTLTAPGTPFVLTGQLDLSRRPSPAIYTDAPDTYPLVAKAAQADFSALVTRDNPAPAGSTIHIWLTGLGPLDRPLATGESGPVNPPAKPLSPFACYIENESGIPAVRGLELPFVAYAPGLLGVYQVDLTIPSDWPAGAAILSCTLDDGSRNATALTHVSTK